jgi:glycosyltransferase involved in cell wall biosynthesis
VLKERHPGLRVAIAGRGPLDAELRAQAEALGLADTVEFLGFVGDMGRLYADSAVFVLPSRSEGLSIAVCEAMAVGLPVVATDVGEIRDVVVPGENGELFGVGDVDAFVAATDAMLRDPERRATMGRAASATVRAYCTRSRVSEINQGIFGAAAS